MENGVKPVYVCVCMCVFVQNLLTESVVEELAFSLALAADVLAQQVDVAEDDERRWKDRSSLVLDHHDVTLELPQQV